MSSAFYSFISSITNSITSRYDIKQQISSSGLWKIYQGERKTTGKKVALFASINNKNYYLSLNSTVNFQCIDFRKEKFGNKF
jgi:phage-related protein